MECKVGRCKSENFAQSYFIRNYGYCPDCKTHKELTEEDLEQLKKEGKLLYREKEIYVKKDSSPPKKTTTRKKQPAKSTPKKVTIPAQTLGKKAPFRKVTRGPKKKEDPKPKKKTAPKKKKTQPKQQVTSCSDHPTYGVVRAPRTDCKTCWKLYEAKHPLRAEKYLMRQKRASS